GGGGGTRFDEFVFRCVGEEGVGAITPMIYSAAIDTPVNRRFVKEFRTKYKKVPGYYGEASYTAARWINEAAKAVGGNVEDKEKFLAALRRGEIPDAPRGPNKLHAYANPIDTPHFHPLQ